jgi:hypothetical protein
MSSVPSSHHSALTQLADRLEAAADQWAAVDGIVIYRPDIQHEEFEEEARRIFEHDLLPDEFDDGRHRFGHGPHGAQCAAYDWENWIPPGCYLKTDQHGGEIWRYAVRHWDGQRHQILWQFFLVGSHLDVRPDPRCRQWEMLTTLATRLILCGSGRGDTPASSWLIYLADRAEPLRPRPWEPPTKFRRDQRRIVTYGLHDGRPIWGHSASQPDKQGGRRLHPWWAVRLNNVFWESAMAVRSFIESDEMLPGSSPPSSTQTKSQSPVSQPPDCMMEPHRYQAQTGKTQEQLADDTEVMRILGRKVEQPTISRYLSRARDWLAASGQGAEPPECDRSKPVPVDPAILDRGANLEHRPKHQRLKPADD